MPKRFCLFLALATVAFPAMSFAAEAATWTTLGTNAGPIPVPERSEPANLLQVPGTDAILVDAGDGAAWQLAKAGVEVKGLKTLILSHLHFDHTGGVFAIISERLQMAAPGTLTIYGPSGTKELVRGIFAAMRSAPPAGSRGPSARDMVKVVEIQDGSDFAIGPVKIKAAANTHYVATANNARFVSLSFRFETPGRTIVFTGDTGPSDHVEQLAQGADLLVSEISDPDIFAQLKAARPDIPKPQADAVRAHFEKEHLSPTEVGLLAQRAGVKALVLTHNTDTPEKAEALRPDIEKNYKASISFAKDLDRF